MILAYALGGGLGHLVRLRAAAFTLGWTERVVVITAAEGARDPRVLPPSQFTVRAPPAALRRDRAGLRAFVDEAARELKPDLFLLDAFFAGILGELAGFAPPCPALHLARRLRMEAYRRRLTGPGPELAEALLLEELEPAHAAALDERAARCRPLTLRDPPCAPPALKLPEGRPVSLVVHSGPPAEQAALRALAEGDAGGRAEDRAIVCVSPGAGQDVFPAWPLFGEVDTVVTGAGFNAMRQAAAAGSRHLFASFDRALDDQAWRAARAAR